MSESADPEGLIVGEGSEIARKEGVRPQIPPEHGEAISVLKEGRALLQQGQVAAAERAFRKAAELEHVAAKILASKGGGPSTSVVAEAGVRAALAARDLNLATKLARLGLDHEPPTDLTWYLRLALLEAKLLRLLGDQAPWDVRVGQDQNDPHLLLSSPGRNLKVWMTEKGARRRDSVKDIHLEVSVDAELAEISDLLESWPGNNRENEVLTTWTAESLLAWAA